MKSIAWLIPRVTKGSGGHRTIIQHVNLLSKNGYKCDIYVKDDVDISVEEIKKQINEFYMECSSDVYKGFITDKKYDIVFATSWDTVKPAKKIKAGEYFYFVQDYEPYFFSMGDSYLSAESTYNEGFKTLTIGRWLSYKLYQEFNVQASYFSFCADLNIYKKEDVEKENAICAIFQPNKPRRCVNLLIAALKKINELAPDIKIYIYGSPKKEIKGLNVCHLGIITPKELNDLYNKCKIGISMSASNPSRIPFEMMASGLPVVDLYRENNLYDLPDSCVVLSDSTPDAIASTVLELYDDNKKQEKMSKNSLAYMQKYPLEKGYEEFINAFNDLLNNKANSVSIDKIYKNAKSLPNKKYIKKEDDSIIENTLENDPLGQAYLEKCKELDSILNSKRYKIARLITNPFLIFKVFKRKK